MACWLAREPAGLCRRGRAVVKETEKVRDVRDIWSHHVARWSVRVAMVVRVGVIVGLKSRESRRRESFDR